MSYRCFDLPNSKSTASDVVITDYTDAGDKPCFSHYSYAMPCLDPTKRGIELKKFRDWRIAKNAATTLRESDEYFPGKSVLTSNATENAQIDTACRLGALEFLANISSGRISANDKDPFRHQLSLQQFMSDNLDKVSRLLIADEVGLGKTIEVGLIVRDILLKNPEMSCLYLTKGGLVSDVESKLKSVIKDVNGALIQIIPTFRNPGYGHAGSLAIRGIHIGSMDAAKLYVSSANKNRNSKNHLPQDHEIAPDILIIDESHYCAATEDSINPASWGNQDVTQAYKMAYELITGTYWPQSKPPKLVIFMSATPFRSEPQFINLLRLLTHHTRQIPNAYSKEISHDDLVASLAQSASPVKIVWRQQESVKSWSGQRLFPNLTIIRPHNANLPENEIRLDIADDRYANMLNRITESMKSISSKHGVSLRGFAIRHLQMRLTSSSIAAACTLFRWCVQHSGWTIKADYRSDNTEATEKLRELLRKISTTLLQFDEDNNSKHASVDFPQDDFTFTAGNLQDGQIPKIWEYKDKLSGNTDEKFVASSDELRTIAEHGLELLSFDGVENAKLEWLKKMLECHPKDKFLVFTESLQTCAVIKTALGEWHWQDNKNGICGSLTGKMQMTERERVTTEFCRSNGSMRVLVATSAADEGFDFQVANKVVHWDLHPSPATLMQRNGRLARLGQVSDVNAYYLIVQGTHEARREQALLERFAGLGITNEVLKLKILGYLDDNQEAMLHDAVEQGNTAVLDNLLKTAESLDRSMAERFSQISHELDCHYVIDREIMANRLKRWADIGFATEIAIKFKTIEWTRPVFNEAGATSETTQAHVAEFKEHNAILAKLTFNPEFKVFGGDAQKPYKLAGLKPWMLRGYVQDNREIVKIRSMSKETDPIGYLCYQLSRLRCADFAVIPSGNVKENPKLAKAKNARFILVASHPLQELENEYQSSKQGYLSYYAFDDTSEKPLHTERASAEEMHELIRVLEDSRGVHALDDGDKKVFEEGGRRIARWLDNSRQVEVTDFLGSEDVKYFMPVPIALIVVLEG